MGQKQTKLAGTQCEHLPDVTAAAEAYVEARDARQRLTTDEVATRGALSEAMRKHDLPFYEDEDAGLRVKVTTSTPTTKIQVERIKAEPDEGDGE